MRTRFLLAAITAALALAGCNKSGTGNEAVAPPAAKVAAVAAPAGTSWLDTVVETPEGGIRMGNPDAPIKLVEYGSRTCPVCGAFGREATQPLEKNYIETGKVSWEFREYLVHGQPDIPASLLGRCVDKQAFFPMLEQMYINQGPIEQKFASPEAQALQQKMQGAKPEQIAAAWGDYLGYVDFVKQRGVPEEKARACLADTKLLERLVKGMQEGDAKQVTGTPTFFLNGRKTDAVGWPQLENALKALGA